MEVPLSDRYSIDFLRVVIVYIYQYGNIMIYILGTIGNLLCIGIFLRKKWRKNVCVFYFLVCLILSLIYLNCIILATSLMTGWNINVLHTSLFICKLMLYVSFVTSTLIPTVLILASVDRLLISSQNIDTRLYSSRRLAYLLIGISTLFWILFNIHTLIKVNIYQLGPSFFICYYELSPFYLNFVNYSLTVFNCVFCVLMIILSIVSLKNVRHICAIPRQQRKDVRTMTKRDFQLLRCLFVQDVVYISVSISSSFYAVYKMSTREYERTALQIAILDFLENIFNFIYFTFYCSSFFIFIFVSKAFRQEMKQLICKMVGKNVVVLHGGEEEQQQQNNIEIVVNVVSTTVM